MGNVRRALLVAALLGGVASADTKPSYSVKQQIAVPDGMTERRGEVLDVQRQTDGRYTYRVKMRDTGEIVTLTDAIPEPPPAAVVEPPPALPTTKPRSLPSAQTARDTAGLAKAPWENSGLSLYQPGTPTTAPTDLPKPSTGFALKLPSFMRPTPKPTPSLARLPVPTAPSIAKLPPVPALDILPPVPEAPAPLPALVATPSEDRVTRLAAMLRESLLPSTREVAALELFEEAGNSANVRPLLLHAAATDPAGTVRASCLRCLAKLQIRDAAYEELLRTAKNDPHPRVREELELAQDAHRPARIIPAAE